MMNAFVYENYGSPDVLKAQRMAKPSPKSNQLLIKIITSTVNRTDCGFLRGKPHIVRFFSGMRHPKYTILGNEFAGIVEAIGSDVREFKIGDRVFGYNDTEFGGHAEYTIANETGPVATIPPGLSFEHGACISEGAHYALSDILAAKVQSGQHVLINGGTGGIGSAAIQLVKYYGAKVTAVCDGKHTELVKSIGADVVIDYTTTDFTKIKELENQFDFIFDAVGMSTFFKCKPLLKAKGIYISTEFGPWVQNPFLALTTPFLGGKKLLFPIPFMKKKTILFLKELVENGHFKPVIDKVYPLENIADAFRYVESKQKIGNVVINVQAP